MHLLGSGANKHPSGVATRLKVSATSNHQKSRTMFSANRVFSQRNNVTGQIEWFFEAREGIMGPYESAAYANKALDEFKKRCLHLGSDGGRTVVSKGNFKLAQGASGLNTLKMDPVREK
jgi:hypothetical protein